jgi:ABC-2 type transport system ATP-binding protein
MISATNLTKRYGDTVAVDDMSFDINGGECVGLLGLNGAGKTTLLRIMSCLLTPTAGQITVGGADATKTPEKVLTQIGYLPDVPPLYDEMTVRGYLEFAAGLRQVPSSDIRDRVDDTARKCALDAVMDQRIDTLSFGYRKRVGIAQAVVHSPPLLILDEPIAGLDPAQIVSIRELLLSLRGEHTIVISSHILSEISQVCDRILVVHNGRIVASGNEASLSKKLGEAFSLVVTVKGDDDRAASIAKGIPEVTGCNTRREGDHIALEVTASADVRAALSRALVEAGLDLLALYQKRDQLESVFLDLTGGKRGNA